MDVLRELKDACTTGELIFGQKQAKASCSDGKAKLIVFSMNCPEEYVTELSAEHSGVTMYRVNVVNRELGAVCGKPFPVSAIAILDPGRSKLLSLKSNL
ncbi:MAG: 50S ribosomal protein L30e [Euryarchaeota archaeon]|nr:50S ribosomal protein L30e [Euryarchaeota archaeon]